MDEGRKRVLLIAASTHSVRDCADRRWNSLPSIKLRQLAGSEEHDTRLNREVAIKVLPESVSSDPERLRRFEQEARAAAALNHPNILAVYQMATHEGASYMVTELLEGETLRERLRRRAIPLRNAIDYGVQIARGLAVAHEKGIVHRDLKPENLFLTRDGRATETPAAGRSAVQGRQTADRNADSSVAVHD